MRDECSRSKSVKLLLLHAYSIPQALMQNLAEQHFALAIE